MWSFEKKNELEVTKGYRLHKEVIDIILKHLKTMKMISTKELQETKGSQKALAMLAQLSQQIKGPEQFGLIDKCIHDLNHLCNSGYMKHSDIHSAVKNMNGDYLTDTVSGVSIMKPYGYSGDFKVIDDMYIFKTSKDANLKVWDDYFHRSSSAIAVRNRKDYFKNSVKASFNGDKNFELLNLASGPARDLLEMYQETPGSDKIMSTCVDMDPHAINYASNLTEAYSDNVKFEQANIFRYQTSQKFDMIWSAGLFDYFTDEVFVKILARFKDWIKQGGQIIIGNFNESHNPSRTYMELLGDWYLNHRTEMQLTELAVEAGYPLANISIGREEQNVNLFLRIRC